MNADATPVASPCNNVCKMDARSGWCLGCYRTLDEIASWSSLEEWRKRAVVEALAPRREAASAQRVARREG